MIGNIETKKVDITPDVSLLPKLGQTGYRVYESLAEFIDNALDARQKDQRTVTVKIELTAEYVQIKDDAMGMDEETAINALKLAYTEKKNKLGQFGLGLKTASTSLGKKFEVITSKAGDKNWYVLKYDEEEWLKSKDWTSFELVLRPKENSTKHGTIIKIQKLTFPFYPNVVTNVKKQLSFQFGPFIENGQLKLKVNRVYVEAPVLDLVNDKKYEVNIPLKNGKTITGWYGFLKKKNVGGRYGFNLYKNGRLIKKEQKIGFKPHPEVATIYGELNLDYVPATHNKREFITNSYEYKEAEEAIKKFVKENKITSKARSFAERLAIEKTERRVKNKLGSLVRIFDTIEEIRNPHTIEAIEESSTEIVEKEEIEKIKNISLFSKEFDITALEEGEAYDLVVGGKKYKFEFNFRPLGPDQKWMIYYVENGKMNIIINIDFQLYPFIKDPSTYSLIFITEAISDHIIKEYGLEKSRVLEVRDIILRRIGEAQADLEKEIKKQQEIKRLEKKLAGLKEDA